MECKRDTLALYQGEHAFYAAHAGLTPLRNAEDRMELLV
jgi:hypothetical protein